MSEWFKVKWAIVDETGARFEFRAKARRIEQRTIFDVPDGAENPAVRILAEAGSYLVIDEARPGVPIAMSGEQFEKYYQRESSG